MGRARARERREQDRREQEDGLSEARIAAFIAAVISTAVALAAGAVPIRPLPTGVTPAIAIARLLLRLPDGPDEPVARRVATLVVNDLEGLKGGSETVVASQKSNLMHRAHYAINASKRVAKDVIAGEGVEKAISKEKRHFVAHRDAERRRIAAAKMIEAAAQLHGPVLGWRHGHPKEPRPNHLAADGKNFRADSIPTSTGALPGVLPNCTCVPTAPFPNAELLS